MKKSLFDILKGKYLISEHSLNNWIFIVFLSLLGIIMISSAHSAERKVHHIARLSNDVKELKSVFVETRSRVMKAKMESRMLKELAHTGLKQSDKPPYKIVVTQKIE